MGLLANKLGIRALSMEDPAQPLLPYSALVESLGLGRSDAGVMVNEKQAMRITTVYACVHIISTDVSSLPLPIYQKLPDASTREATEHPYYGLIHDEANPWMSSMTFRATMLANALGWGNGYALLRRNKGGRVVSMVPLPPEKTSPVMWKGELWYATTATIDGQVSYIRPEDVLHIMGLSTDGYVGLSPIQTCKNAFGLALGAEKFGAQFFGNGAKATGVLSHPGSLDTEAYENLKKSLREMMTGENALRPLLLEENMKWEQTSTNPNDAQFLETRQFQRSEIAALYRVAMHLLQDLQRATNNNIEHQSLDHLRYCLRPWCIRYEQEVNRKILGVDSGFFCEHDMNAFQRGDFASQTTGLATLRAAGYFSVNDGLRVMRMNTISAEDGGDLRLAPINMMPLEQMLEGPQQDDGSGDGSPTDPDAPIEPITDLRRERIVNAYRRLFRDAVGRTIKRSKPDARWVAQAFEPVLTTMAETLLTMFVGGKIELTDEDLSKIRAHAVKIAAESASWTAENASITATSLTNQAYTALAGALVG